MTGLGDFEKQVKPILMDLLRSHNNFFTPHDVKLKSVRADEGEDIIIKFVPCLSGQRLLTDAEIMMIIRDGVFWPLWLYSSYKTLADALQRRGYTDFHVNQIVERLKKLAGDSDDLSDYDPSTYTPD